MKRVYRRWLAARAGECIESDNLRLLLAAKAEALVYCRSITVRTRFAVVFASAHVSLYLQHCVLPGFVRLVSAVHCTLWHTLQRIFLQVAATPDSQPRVKVTPFKGQKGIVSKLKLTCAGESVEVNKVHYDKLRVLYAMTEADPTAPFNASDFTRAACAVLFRYSSLQGTHYRGGGFQVCFHVCYAPQRMIRTTVFFALNTWSESHQLP
jgi:hypothetical protein